jgi:hypothetical protein
MQDCPWCGTPFDGAAPFCTNCGKERVVEGPSTSLQVVAKAGSPQVVPKAASPRVTFSQQSVMAVAAGLAVLGITLVALGRRDAPTPEQPTAAGVTGAAAPAPAPSTIDDSPTAPTWVGRRQTTWARDGSKTISFEVEAASDVPVWMTRVRPVLVVRCLYRRTEVFVQPGSAASIEGHADNHTVRLRVDEDPEVVQQWSGSVSGQELFAPDGVALARRLAHARRMQFGFTPYNAKPVSAQFRVEGFDQLAGLVAKTCGWRVDDPATPAVRSAGVK